MKCAVANCNSGNDNHTCNISFFVFPANKDLKKKWISFCRREKNFNTENFRVCMLHFKPEDIENGLQYGMGFVKHRFLKRGVVPTINTGSLGNIELSAQRTSRIKKRENKKIVNSLLQKAYAEDTAQQQQDVEVGKGKDGNMVCFNDSETCIEDVQSNSGAEDEKSKSFTKGQTEKLKNGMKKSNWTEEDITQSISLHATSAKLYKLLYRKKFPLPAVRTPQTSAQKMEISRGLIQPVFKVLSASTHLTDKQKICVLSFDEMKVRKIYCYDRSSDTTLAPVTYVQVAML
ncbi:uncharacterized protein LOC131806837 [Musca domestica]|uniref:Uncharacterized protein LOC131806837 n=1 Tax=Musca domestica TaxID=7370 RepID=A0ABM3VP92_MUSDO|nr:uncharacterized protein LOC131806837 [Musca domestica]